MKQLPNRMLQYCEHETNVATQFFEADSLEEAFHSDEIRNRVWCAVMHYKLNELISDPTWQVRYAIADQGFGLDLLLNDEDEKVRKIAQKKIWEEKMVYRQWCSEHPEKCMLPENYNIIHFDSNGKLIFKKYVPKYVTLSKVS